MADTQLAAMLETTAIQHAKFQLRIAVNTKSRDDVPHDGYSPERPAALYAVPVRPHITTQQQFEEEHVSYYLKRKGKPKLSKQQKRAKLLDELIDAIPMQQLQRAFIGTSAGPLRQLQLKYGFKESNTAIYSELRVLFDERY